MLHNISYIFKKDIKAIESDKNIYELKRLIGTNDRKWNKFTLQESSRRITTTLKMHERIYDIYCTSKGGLMINSPKIIL
ncbi:hypothetical protein ACV07N_13160 [Roseivirga echinicomitans]